MLASGAIFSGTPILLLVFNRPEGTRAVMESIRTQQPPVLYVAADGPRMGIAGDIRDCAAARELATNVDWKCTVKTLLRDENHGAGRGVVEAIDWFFDAEPEGIILEDDCVASGSFYRFCGELLQHYRNESRVMHISGSNFQYGRRRGRASYYFSRYMHGWGWATWSRAWRNFDFGLIPEGDRSHVWDAAWAASVQRNNGVGVIPNVNLVTNIGVGPDATHTRTPARFAFLPARELEFPLVHPVGIKVDGSADSLTYYANFRNIPSLRLLWLYRALDFVKLIPARLQKAAAWIRRRRRAAGERRHG
jgi:hypothetical protein